MPGTFTISLDFELFWGVHDRRELKTYARNILGAREAIVRMLDLFERYGVHCTWATVGLLFFDRKDELFEYLPEERPRYANPALSPYPRVAQIGPSERADPYHYGLSLLRRIRDCPHQEIGTHTFSHYYCLEEGGSPDAFRADLEAARKSAARLDITLRSLVFPRNQFSEDHLGMCRDAGIEAVRGNPPCWVLRRERSGQEGVLTKAYRRLDQYLPLSGNNAVIPEGDRQDIVNVRASRFLLTVPTRSRIFGPLCHHRITAAMTHAARAGHVYHLWWHPHNFGAQVDENMTLLRRLLDHYRALGELHGMRSWTMGEIAAAARRGASHSLDNLRSASPEPRPEAAPLGVPTP